MKRHYGRSAALLSLILASSLGFVGCSASTVITSLTVIVDATAAGAAVVTALASGGTLAGPSVGIALNYIENANAAASNAISEWESADSVSVKITKITEEFAAVGLSSATGINNAEVSACINAISTAIQDFLGQIHASAAQAHLLRGPQNAILPMSFSDRHKLGPLKTKTLRTKEQIAAWRAQNTAKGSK